MNVGLQLILIFSQRHQLNLSIIFSSLQYDPLTPVSATLDLLLVEDVTITPSAVTIYNHPDVRVSA